MVVTRQPANASSWRCAPPSPCSRSLGRCVLAAAVFLLLQGLEAVAAVGAGANVQGGCTSKTATDDVRSIVGNTMVNKTVISDVYRVVFLAGVGGTGHHLFQSVMRKCAEAGLCRDAPFRKSLWNAIKPKTGFWSAARTPDRRLYCWVQQKMATAMADAPGEQKNGDGTVPFLDIVNTLEQTGKTGMISYPNYYRTNAFAQPDMRSLAYLGEQVGADVRIVVLLREPYAQLSSVHRRFGKKSTITHTVDRFAKAQLKLVRQLRHLDTRFYTCIRFETLAMYGDAVDVLLQGGRRHGEAGGDFTFKSAIEDIIDPTRVAKYTTPDVLVAKYIKDHYAPTYNMLVKLCGENTIFGDF